MRSAENAPNSPGSCVNDRKPRRRPALMAINEKDVATAAHGGERQWTSRSPTGPARARDLWVGTQPARSCLVDPPYIGTFVRPSGQSSDGTPE